MKRHIALGFILAIGWMGCSSGPGQSGSTFTQQIAKEEKGSVVFLKVSTNEGEGLGSGIIVKSSGQILTAHHVIKGIKEGWAKPFKGTWMPITGVVAQDELKDLAVINVDPRNQHLQQSRLGSGEYISSGDPVVAIGNPLGLEYSVTEGIISEVRTTPEGLRLIQTDAAVSPGNSGGPLFDQNGEVIGVVSFNLSSSHDEGQNLNFAVSIDEAKPLLGIPSDQFEPVQVGVPPPETRSKGTFRYMEVGRIVWILVFSVIVYLFSAYILFSGLIKNRDKHPATAFGISALVSWVGFAVIASFVLSGLFDFLMGWVSGSQIEWRVFIAGLVFLIFIVVIVRLVSRPSAVKNSE